MFQTTNMLETTIYVLVRSTVLSPDDYLTKLGCFAQLDRDYPDNYNEYSLWRRYIVLSNMPFFKMVEEIEKSKYFVVDLPKKRKQKSLCYRRPRSNSLDSINETYMIPFLRAKVSGFVTHPLINSVKNIELHRRWYNELQRNHF